MSPAVTERFSDRVANYIKHRPGYPAEVLAFLREKIGLRPEWVIADIGSGTGISSEFFLKNGNAVFAVEPNGPMRQAAEKLLGGYARFRSVNATAEATTLEPRSVALIVAAQAFHWFDQRATRSEFERVLRPGGWILLMWNERRIDSTPFLRAYEKMLLTYSPDYAKVRHENVTEEVLRAFFAPQEYEAKCFENRQVFDFQGLKGRLMSSSYAPKEGEAGHEAMMEELRRMFEEHQREGVVYFDYDTRVYYARLD